MPVIALADEQETVNSLTGSGDGCSDPLSTTTGPNTYDKVKIENFPPVLQGDLVKPHPALGCGPDTSTLSTFSTTVFINGKGVGRKDDQYTNDNIIMTGCSTVFAG